MTPHCLAETRVIGTDTSKIMLRQAALQAALDLKGSHGCPAEKLLENASQIEAYLRGAPSPQKGEDPAPETDTRTGEAGGKTRVWWMGDAGRPPKTIKQGGAILGGMTSGGIAEACGKAAPLPSRRLGDVYRDLFHAIQAMGDVAHSLHGEDGRRMYMQYREGIDAELRRCGATPNPNPSANRLEPALTNQLAGLQAAMVGFSRMAGRILAQVEADERTEAAHRQLQERRGTSC